MKLDEIQLMWERDAQIDRTELGEESLRIPLLHAKYFKVFSQERMTLRKLEAEYKQLYRDKYEWYNGSVSEDTLKSREWEPNPLKILRTDIPMYIEADSIVQTHTLRIEMQKEKVDFVEAIIKSLVSRGYQIKGAIDWEKFKMGN